MYAATSATAASEDAVQQLLRTLGVPSNWDPSIAPSGMDFYSGNLFSKWKGNLIVGALKFRLLTRLVLDGEKVTREERLLEGLGERIRQVRQGPEGFIYLLTDSNEGRVLRLGLG